MPTSIDPPLGENELECARCGERFPMDLTRCPKCGVNLYEPEDEREEPDSPPPRPGSVSAPGLGARWGAFWRRLSGRLDPADELFARSQEHVALYGDLLNKTGGDHAAVERLIQHESRLSPSAGRTAWLRSAIRRWEKDNR